MAKPQQPELRRSGFVPALDPDATESRLDAHERPSDKGRGGPVPDEQRRGHHPEHEQDKPDLDAFAERLGIVSEDEEPADAPHVEDDERSPSTVTPLTDAPSKQQAREQQARDREARTPRPRPAARSRNWSPIGLVLVAPVTGVLVARGVVRAIIRLRR